MRRREDALRLVDRLLEAVPAAREPYDAHLAEYRELDPEEFFMDLAEWTNASFTAARVRGVTSGPWLEVLNFLEREYAYANTRVDNDDACEYVDNLIGTYFDISLAKPGKFAGEVREYLGPSMSELGVSGPSQVSIDGAEQLAARMLQAVPETEAVYRRYVDSLGGAFGLFGWELMSWTVDRFVESQQRGETTGPWRALLDFFERECAAVNERHAVDEVARAVAQNIGEFVDSLPEPGQPGAELANYVGSNLRDEMFG